MKPIIAAGIGGPVHGYGIITIIIVVTIVVTGITSMPGSLIIIASTVRKITAMQGFARDTAVKKSEDQLVSLKR